ncbi:TIGR02281 family clan AA aspartic protease [Erythrobacter sp. JK5]|uniref:retropepsin-like aspartic protease family protein n=1 Tax=Erythrobacter sp. JK5 TaxID=2829500 RepID=UPI001BA81E52|nr:TIGR02281 family clan AA aspartic protease [Erythrobacter sp. JK5]QUL37762.1 TIGR02281 family clan AA aspartic protease [Erythrobacter sp. JK5]
MLGRTLIFAAAVFGFVALVVPMSDEEADDAAGDGLTQAGASGASASADWFAGDHTLRRQSDGHFYASATIDGVPVRMMVDTGASVIALTGSDASAIGLYWDDDDVTHIGQGANGAVFGVPTRLDEVEIGGMTRRDVSAVIIPEGLGVSLLGQSYLSQIGAVEIADDRMIMSSR